MGKGSLRHKRSLKKEGEAAQKAIFKLPRGGENAPPTEGLSKRFYRRDGKLKSQ